MSKKKAKKKVAAKIAKIRADIEKNAVPKAKPKKDAGGRPSSYKPEYVEQVKHLCKLGATDKQLAEYFGVGEKTLNNWKKTYPEFLQSLKDAKAELDNRVVRSLFERAIGYSHPEEKIFCSSKGRVVRANTIKHYPPDPTSMIFWLKNRDKENWRDKIEHQHGGPNDGPIPVSAILADGLDQNQIAQLYKQMLSNTAATKK